MTDPLREMRAAEGSGPWLHPPRRPGPRPRNARWYIRAVLIGAIIAAIAAAFLPAAADPVDWPCDMGRTCRSAM